MGVLETMLDGIVPMDERREEPKKKNDFIAGFCTMYKTLLDLRINKGTYAQGVSEGERAKQSASVHDDVKMDMGSPDGTSSKKKYTKKSSSKKSGSKSSSKHGRTASKKTSAEKNSTTGGQSDPAADLIPDTKAVPPPGGTDQTQQVTGIDYSNIQTDDFDVIGYESDDGIIEDQDQYEV